MALLLFFKPEFMEWVGYFILIVCFFVLMTSAVRIKKIISEAKGKDYKSYTWIGK